MHAMFPLLQSTDFPVISRRKLTTLQVNLGYKCNQACFHCHVNAGPNRTEMMDSATLDTIIQFLQKKAITTLDITGGAPELHPEFRRLVSDARQLDIKVMDRCNLTILLTEGQEDTAEFLAANKVEIVASLPCYLEDNVNAQRGDGVFQDSITALKKLNALGYGQQDSELTLNLVYNPVGPTLPPAQNELEQAYKKHLKEHYDIVFNQLFTLANMPIARFGSTLVSKGKYHEYMALLKASHSDDNLQNVMCRDLISVDWQGYVYDCDFNQMLSLPLAGKKQHLSTLLETELDGQNIAIADHCYGCTAGQGSSCGGALS